MVDWKDRIEIDGDKMIGKPVIKDTRIPIEKILQLLGSGLSPEEIIKDYPHLEEKDIQAAINYAADMLQQEKIFPLSGDEVEISG